MSILDRQSRSTFRLANIVAAVVLLLILFWSRLHQLEALPLYNDEGLHLTRAVKVWEGKPFWEIIDGKIINHWLIAAFDPRHDPVFVGRIATIWVMLVGAAAGFALLRHGFGLTAALYGLAAWIAAPHLFFYERVALSDAEAGALAVLALWCAWQITQRRSQQGAIRWAAFTGLTLSLATLFKFSAAPYAISVAIIVLTAPRVAWARRWRNLLLIGVGGVVTVAPFAAYALWRRIDFGIAAGWLSDAGQRTQGWARVAENLQRFGSIVFGYGYAGWGLWLGLGLLAFGLIALTDRTKRRWLPLWLAVIWPCIFIIGFSSDVQVRHFAVTMPALIVISGAGLAWLVTGLLRRLNINLRWISLIPAALGLVWIVPFAATAYTDPGALPLPSLDRYQFITSHSAGFGLREAIRDLPRQLPPSAIVASMFPDSCRRAAFYAPLGYTLICGDAPGIELIRAALRTEAVVYVLRESPPIGLDWSAYGDLRAESIAGYARPDDPADAPAITLWKVQRR